MYGDDAVPPSEGGGITDNSTDNSSDNATDNSTDNSTENTPDNSTDNETDNETEDNETVKKLKELFAGVYDNYSCENPSDPVLFPYGTRLENCVRKYSNAVRWPMLCGQAALITAIECDDPEITSLDGLQQFPNLKSLSFSLKGTKVESLAPIRNLTGLETLEIPYSEISEIGFLARMKKLKNLDLKGNRVTDLEFIPFINSLETLSLEYQGPDYIKDITPMGSLVRMRVLSLQGNKITDISPLSGMIHMTYLSLRDNRISDLSPLSGMTELSGLDFSINMVTSLSPLDNLTRLNVLVGSSNRISDISPLDNLTELRDLQLLNNSVSDVSVLSRMKKAKRLVFDYNVIKDISSVADLTLTANIQELGLSYNCIPRENYRKVPYINDIQILRLDHQCENYPEDAFPDNQTVVNSDLVNGKNTLEDDNITLSEFESTAGGGCSALPYGALPAADAAWAALAALLLVRGLRRKK